MLRSFLQINLLIVLQVLSGGTAVNIGIWGHATAENIKEEGWDPEAIKSAYEHLDARLAHPGIVGPVQEKVLEAWQEQGLGPNNGVTPEHIVRCHSPVDLLFLGLLHIFLSKWIIRVLWALERKD